MKKFLESPERTLEGETLTHLVYGWANEVWSAWAEYLAASIEHALVANGPILECGSGLSTVLIGVIARRRGLAHWALEHIPEHANHVTRYLKRYGIDSVVSCAPLRDYGDFVWYDPPLESMPPRFTLVICDGPPGDVKGGRYGLVPLMRSRLEPGSVILLDDGVRRQERSIAEAWSKEIAAPFEVMGRVKPFIRMCVPRPSPVVHRFDAPTS